MNTTAYLSSPLSLSALAPLTITALFWGAVLLCFVLAGRSMWQGRSARKHWDRERIEWGAPRPSLSQRWRMKLSRVRFRAPEFTKWRTQTIAPKPTPPAQSIASAEPLKNPIQLVPPLFEVPSGKPKEAFVWNETKGID